MDEDENKNEYEIDKDAKDENAEYAKDENAEYAKDENAEYAKDENANDDNNEEGEFPSLGDKVIIYGGKFDKTIGTIYYIDDTRWRIMPSGVGNHVMDFEFEEFENYGIENVEIVKLHRPPAFVVQQDYRVGQIAEAFSGLEGEPAGAYVIVDVNEKKDFIVVKDVNNDLTQIDFGFKGIPLNAGFDVLRSRDAPTIDEDVEEDEEGEKEEEKEDLFEDELIIGEETVVFAPKDNEIEVVPSSKRYYSDNVQRTDMLQDLISKLSLKEQQSDIRIQEIRRLTELCLLLRNELTLYANNGVPIGKKDTSFDTLLDLVADTNNSFSKPVMDVKRTLYLDETEEEHPLNTSINIDARYLSEEILKEISYSETQFTKNQNVESTDILPNWYLGWDRYNKENFLSWAPKSTTNATTFKEDREFFRVPYIDDIDTPSVDGLPKVPYPEPYSGDLHSTSKAKISVPIEVPITIEYIGSVLYSQLRGLKGRFGRLKEKQDARLFESPEEGVIDSYLLFPSLYEREFGSTRSGKLAYDMGRSVKVSKTTNRIFREKSISQIPVAGLISAISSTPTTAGNMVVEDWLEKMPMYLYGLGDALIQLKSYGFNQKEFSDQQQYVLQQKIEATIGYVISNITQIRESVTKEIDALQFLDSTLVPKERFEELMILVNSEKILQDCISLFEQRVPFYKNNDVGIFALLNSYSQDLMYAVLAGYPEPIARFRNIFVNKDYVLSLQHALELRIKNEDKFYEPIVNTCPHVASLYKIKGVKDDTQRMLLLSEYLTEYKDYKKDNFIYCLKCKKPCLCEHEYLLQQEFIYPREKETLHKELLLCFSGGVFQGKFICNNCGQAISDLEFDTSLEYNDEGAPMMGRAVLEDEGNEDNEDGVSEPIEGITFETDATKLYYQKAQDFFQQIGISPDDAAYKRIVSGVDGSMLLQPSRDKYIKKAKAEKAKGKRIMDYDEYVNKIMIATILAYSIVEIQTHIPDYVTRYSVQDCVIDLRGFPLGKEGDNRIIHFVSCVASSIIVVKAYQDSNDPWSLSRYQFDSDKKRIANIAGAIELRLKDILTTPTVQEVISNKKQYLLATYGKNTLSEGLGESIPNGFTPYLYEENQKDIIVPAAANTYEKVQGLIRELNKEAKESTEKDISAYTERTCCYSTIETPLGFWKNKSLIEIPSQNVPIGPINSHSAFTFEVIHEQKLDFSISKENYYTLFLKVCFKGVHIGLPHEFGYNRICPYCDFKAPVNAVQGEKALQDQGVEITEITFQKLLNAVHLSTSVDPDTKIYVPSGTELFGKIITITPSPFERWKEILNRTLEELRKLTKDSTTEEFAIAYGEISEYSRDSLGEFKGFVGENIKTIFDQILNQPIRQVIETIQTSILIPLIRIFKGYNLKQLLIDPKTFGFDPYKDRQILDHIKKSITDHTEFIEKLRDKIEGFTKSKIEYAILQLSAFIKLFQEDVRAPLVIGGRVGIPYIVKAGITSILRDMVDQNVMSPITSEDNISLDITTDTTKNILKALLTKYSAERFRLTDEEIKTELAKRAEKERKIFTYEFDELPKDQKTIALQQRKLGISGRATGNVSKYSDQQFAIDQEQRIRMGFESNGFEATDNGYDHNQPVDE